MIIPANSRVLFFGDSITKASDASSSGFVRKMRTWLANNRAADNITIDDSGVSGDRVAHLLARFTAHVANRSPRPTHLIVFIGINDAGAGGTVPTPMATYEAGLRSLIAQTQALGITPVLASPAVIGEKLDGGNPLDAQVDSYVATSALVADDLDVEFVNTRAAFFAFLNKYNVENDPYGVLLPSDLVHPNAMGHLVLADAFLTLFGRV